MITHSFQHLLASSSPSRDPREALSEPVSALLGLNETAAEALKAIEIQSVFDLACSSVFRTAVSLTAASDHTLASEDGYVALAHQVPRDMLDDVELNTPVSELPEKPLVALRSINSTMANKLSAALSIKTIRDLAFWPPYRAAVAIFNEAYGLGAHTGPDAEAPADLIPQTGRYPTEQVHYEITLLDRVLDARRRREEDSEGHDLKALEAAGPIDVTSSSEMAGFTRPAVGAILRYTQSWYTEGLSLGQLLHSVALAPGETTRIAMIDWSRRSRAGLTEAITETEFLTHDLERNRSISEVTHAVAVEAQRGWSVAGGAGFSTLGGEAAGAAGLIPNLPIVANVGSSMGFGGGLSAAGGYATTSGRREINADMTQEIQDRTHQHATSARNRWATVVREVSQSESERISTRSLTNYNHMHALSIQYYEVVQLYRVVLKLSRVTRCLFVPMKVLNFRTSKAPQQFRKTILDAALHPAVRALAIADPDTLLFRAPNRVKPWPSSVITSFNQYGGKWRADDIAIGFHKQITVYGCGIMGEDDPNLVVTDYFDEVVVEETDGTRLSFAILTRGQFDIDGFGTYRTFFENRYQATPPHYPFSRVTSIKLRKKQAQSSFAGNVQVFLGIEPTEGGEQFFMHIPVKVPANQVEVDLLEITHTISDAELIRHLDENALYYSQVIWQSLDGATLGHLLDDYSIGGKPLIDVIDPRPVSAVGNYLVFRMPADERAERGWTEFLDRHGLKLGQQQADLVPLPSGGVFAEAVLGRFNSAEKLDITRFWNWQDSPIPITAPEIAAIQAGSRAQPEDVKPSQLGAPVLNVVNAPDLPAPQGLAAVLQAVSAASLFRDMSGLAGTQELVRNFLQETMRGAGQGAAQAGQNAATAATLADSLLGGLGSGSRGATSPPTISNAGARINHGLSLDERGGGREIQGNGVTETGASELDGQSGMRNELDAFRSDLGDYSFARGGFEGGGGGGFFSTVRSTVEDAVKGTKPPTLPDEHPSLADKAAHIGNEALLVKAYEEFQLKNWHWWFSPNTKLAGAVSKPSKLNTWTDWDGFSSWRHRQVLADIAGLNPATMSRNSANLSKLKNALADWPSNYYAVFQSGTSEETNTCNLFLGDALTLDGREQIRPGGKYYSAQQVYQGMGKFEQVPPFYVVVGDIACWGGHVEIITKVDYDAGTFCSRGGFRTPVGSEKCESQAGDGRRKLDAANLRFMRVAP